MTIIEKNLVWDGRLWENGSAVLDDAAAALLSSTRTSESLLLLAVLHIRDLGMHGFGFWCLLLGDKEQIGDCADANLHSRSLTLFRLQFADYMLHRLLYRAPRPLVSS
jgi:hypothetical protein